MRLGSAYITSCLSKLKYDTKYLIYAHLSQRNHWLAGKALFPLHSRFSPLRGLFDEEAKPFIEQIKLTNNFLQVQPIAYQAASLKAFMDSIAKEKTALVLS